MFRVVVVVCCIANAVAFSALPRTHRHVLGLSKPLRRNRNDAQLQMMSPLALSMPTKVALGIPIMYATMSFSEYFTHRYYQHTDYNRNSVMQFFANLFTSNKGHKIRGGGHVEHHAETLDDMSLRNDVRWIRSPAAVFLNADKYRGTAFSWWAGIISTLFYCSWNLTIDAYVFNSTPLLPLLLSFLRNQIVSMMFLQMLVTCTPFMRAIGWSTQATVAWIIPSLLTHTLVWNALHPAMHGLPDIGQWAQHLIVTSAVIDTHFERSIILEVVAGFLMCFLFFWHFLITLCPTPVHAGITEGPPGRWLSAFRNSKLFKWLELNHVGHHIVGTEANQSSLLITVES